MLRGAVGDGRDRLQQSRLGPVAARGVAARGAGDVAAPRPRIRRRPGASAGRSRRAAAHRPRRGRRRERRPVLRDRHSDRHRDADPLLADGASGGDRLDVGGARVHQALRRHVAAGDRRHRRVRGRRAPLPARRRRRHRQAGRRRRVLPGEAVRRADRRRRAALRARRRRLSRHRASRAHRPARVADLRRGHRRGGAGVPRSLPGAGRADALRVRRSARLSPGRRRVAVAAADGGDRAALARTRSSASTRCG